MKKPPEAIQNSELEVLRVLWDAGEPLPLIEIRRVLAQRCGWEDSTVKTLLRRLQAKGAVKLERRGVYSALVLESDYNARSTQSFLDRLYAGSAKKLVASLVSEGKLSQADIAELSAMFKVGEDYE